MKLWTHKMVITTGMLNMYNCTFSFMSAPGMPWPAGSAPPVWPIVVLPSRAASPRTQFSHFLIV